VRELPDRRAAPWVIERHPDRCRRQAGSAGRAAILSHDADEQAVTEHRRPGHAGPRRTGVTLDGAGQRRRARDLVPLPDRTGTGAQLAREVLLVAQVRFPLQARKTHGLDRLPRLRGREQAEPRLRRRGGGAAD
jgi:hypothetical protein